MPFTILIDQQEKARYHFAGIRANANKSRAPIIVPTEVVYLKTGDYTIRGMKDVVTVERKSLTDLYQTLGQGRDRFEREHERMAEMKRACVVIEASWFDIIRLKPERSNLKPKTVWRTFTSWYARYNIPWLTIEDRRLCELFTFQFLKSAWREFDDDGNNRRPGKRDQGSVD